MAAYQNLIEIEYKLKHLIWDYMVHLDIHHVHENSWCGSNVAAPVSLPACMVWTLILFTLCIIIFHDYYPSTVMHCDAFWTYQYHFDDILLVLTVWEFWGKSGHEIKGKDGHNKADFVEIYFIILIWCFVSLWLYFDIHGDIGLCSPSPTLRFWLFQQTWQITDVTCQRFIK